MRHRYIGLLVVASVVLLIGLGAPQERAPSEPTPDGLKPGANKAAFAPGRILVKIKDNAPADAIVSVNRKNDARLEERIPRSRVSVIDLPENLSVAEAIERYETSPAVEYAEPDYKISPAINAPTPNDPSFPKMYDLYNRGQYRGAFDADIDAPEAWNVTTGSAEVVVAVIDTGIDINHPDLRNNIWTNPGEIPGNKIDDDGNTYVDDVHGWDFFNNDASVFDGAGQDWHGTHVAGTIAAGGNNDRGITGVNWQAKVMPLKFISPKNFGYVSDAAAALDYAVSEGAEISNNSYGWWGWCSGNCLPMREGASRTLKEAIKDADGQKHLFVAAAMNGGEDFIGDNIDDPNTPDVYPASYVNSNIISVAASNKYDTLTSFSNYGSTSVDLAAPGQNILSTLPGNKYGYAWGTSMATPHVAGVAALIKSQSPQLSDDQIKVRILDSVDPMPSLQEQGKLATGGRLNAAKALEANTAPVIVGLRPGGKIRYRRPIITATVQDDETTNLTETQIKLKVDGRLKDFDYDQASGTLTYRSGKLAPRRHRVQVVVDDGQGLVEARTWTFKVVRRR